jgi:hypothetical protein
MKKLEWFERQFQFGVSEGMLPFYIERLTGTSSRLEEKLKSTSDEKLSFKLDGKWSIKQNIGHLAEVDEVANKRIDEMLQGISPISPAVFEPKADYNAMSISDILQLFKSNRLKNVTKFQTLTGDFFNKRSLHPRLNVMMNPVDLAYFDAEHDDHHLVRINEILNTIA